MILMLFCVVSCQSSDDGYVIASAADEIFELRIPGNWQNNLKNGVSGGYSSGGTSSIGSGVMANAATFEAAEGTTLAEYVETLIAEYDASLFAFKVLREPTEASLGEHPALSFDYKMKWQDKATDEETVLKFRCTVAQKPNTCVFAVLSCCAPEDIFDMRTEEFDQIARYFSFREDSEIKTDAALKDKDTPVGYLLASGNQYEFRFFVPDTWIVDTTGEVPCAKFSETDPSNVSLTSFRITQQIANGADYWEVVKKSYPEDLNVISVDDEAKMGGYPALSVEYVLSSGGKDFHVKQSFLSTSSMIYIFTYTADEAHYAEHMADVDSMLSMFEFKRK